MTPLEEPEICIQIRVYSLSRLGAAGPRSVLGALLERAKQRATRPISLRLSVADIEQAKRIAARRGIGYQSVLKEAIRKGLPRSA